MKKIFKSTIFTLTAALFLVLTPLKAEISVVTSIKPLHSLTSYIMEGVGEPELIIDGVASPHNFQIKPSHAKMLQNADLVIWIGEDLESFLPTALKSIPKDAVVFELLDQSGLKKLKFREKNIFEGHDDHGHDEHAKKEDDHDDHGHDDHGHGHGSFDPHIWLDPANAKVIVKKITNQLSKIDKDNASTYKANSKKVIKDLDGLIKEVKNEINKDASFVVFHDAYQYFEKRFGLNVIGALTVNPDVMPGAEQLSEIREVIEHEKAKCIFSEPQFNPNIINSIA
ncbi:zinc ABC transporter substrate-binding protein, partial [Candidatus Pelagibacter sp.]|nr:zinc ABC transporter substrate-binding protein [Candidatus Pelagibacter sp.]